MTTPAIRRPYDGYPCFAGRHRVLMHVTRWARRGGWVVCVLVIGAAALWLAGVLVVLALGVA